VAFRRLVGDDGALRQFETERGAGKLDRHIEQLSASGANSPVGKPQWSSFFASVKADAPAGGLASSPLSSSGRFEQSVLSFIEAGSKMTAYGVMFHHFHDDQYRQVQGSI
jgi:hypothetical protein